MYRVQRLIRFCFNCKLNRYAIERGVRARVHLCRCRVLCNYFEKNKLSVDVWVFVFLFFLLSALLIFFFLHFSFVVRLRNRSKVKRNWEWLRALKIVDLSFDVYLYLYFSHIFFSQFFFFVCCCFCWNTHFFVCYNLYVEHCFYGDYLIVKWSTWWWFTR